MPSTSKILLADSRHAFGREALGLGHDRESVEAPNTKQHSLTDLLLFARSFVLLVSIVVVVATLMRVPCVACACACMRLCVRVSCVAQAIIDAVEGRTPATPRGTASASMPPLVFHHDPTTPSPPLSPHGGGSVTPKRPPPSHMAPPSSAPPPPRRVIEKKYAPSFHISFHISFPPSTHSIPRISLDRRRLLLLGLEVGGWSRGVVVVVVVVVVGREEWMTSDGLGWFPIVYLNLD